MGVIGIIANLREALEAFIDNPNTTNQMVLERAMRVYQSNVTAMEPRTSQTHLVPNARAPWASPSNVKEIECECGHSLQLWAFTNTCEACGRDYNISGHVLSPRAQWGEETGESLGDILRIGHYEG